MYNVLWVKGESAKAGTALDAVMKEKKASLKVSSVSGFTEGREFLQSNNIDVLLLDFSGAKNKDLENLQEISRKFSDRAIIAAFDKKNQKKEIAAIASGAQECFVAGQDLEHCVEAAVARKKLEQDLKKKLRSAGEQAKMATKAKTEFLAKMSHEIRNPLGAILGFSTVLKRSKLTAKQQDQLDTIISCGNLLLGITDDMMDISKIEAGQLKLETAQFNLKSLIEEVIKIGKTRLKNDKVRLYFEVEEGVPEDFYGDSKKLRQILINLINNAIKFTKEGDVSLTVELEEGSDMEKDDAMLRFSVLDTGRGVPSDKKSSIFKLFEQADYSKTRDQGGAGLGLAICKAFVELMGGKIWVESTVGEGSEFIFTVKLKVKGLKVISKDEIPDGFFDETITESNIAQKLDCRGIKVLVAEDGIPSQDLMKAYFEYLGCEADYVVNGKEAIEKIKKNKYDICLMDMGMPVLDGVEATKIIRKEISDDLPIIALTAAAMKRDRDLCLDAGMDDYIKKPVDVITLKGKILLHTKSKGTKKRKKLSEQ